MVKLTTTLLAAAIATTGLVGVAGTGTAQAQESALAIAVDAKALRGNSASERALANQLIDKTRGRGKVAVIVRLDGEFAAEGDIGASAASQQRAGIRGRAEGLLSRMGAGRNADVEQVKTFETAPLVAMHVSRGALEKLLADGDVAMVFEDAQYQVDLAQSTTVVEANKAWAVGLTGSGSVVAVLDTGVNKNHPFLAGKVVSEACYSTTSAASGTTSFCPGGASSSTASNSGLNCPSTVQNCDHGTHVAGIVAGRGGGTTGATFNGVAPDARLIAVQVFSRTSTNQTTAFTSDIIRGLERVYALRSTYRIAAVNMSLGGGRFTSFCDTDPTKPIIDNLRAAGIATVIASGNNGWSDAVSSPGCVSTAMTVGSTTKTDTISSFSNSDGTVDVLAPGSSITSATYSGYSVKSGTSMATPHVAGAFAILKQIKPTGTVTEFENALEATGRLVTDTRVTGGVVKPRIDIQEAGERFTTLLAGS